MPGSEDVTLTWLENLGAAATLVVLYNRTLAMCTHISGGWLGRVTVLLGVVLIRDVGVPNRLLRGGGVCAWFEFHTFDPKQHEK
jgi:hypothetical protein